uniref:PGG domain-containing protein n=1 Tax=Salix viminalis TaxID=40686 RepID=A0A6N2LZR2_SALVM
MTRSEHSDVASSSPEKIFRLVKQQKIPLARLHRVIDNKETRCCTRCRYGALQRRNQAWACTSTSGGVAMQVQEVIPSHYATLPNNEGKTAGDLFKESHEKQLENAQKWIKETTQSCSTVAALVATVVFAAAYTVPGGSDDNGKPNFIDSPYFLVFTVSDVFSLASSLTSLVVFLSLLTSPFEQKDSILSSRKRSLPFPCCYNDHAIFWGYNFDTHSVREKADNITPFHCCIPSSLSICNNAIPSVRLIYGFYIQHSEDNQESSVSISCPLPTMGEKAPSS